MKKGGIYIIICTENGRRYIGSTTDFKRRWKEHKVSLKKQRHENSHLQNAWNKHGREAFEFSVLEIVSDMNLLIEKEQFYLDTLNPEFNIALFAASPTLGLERTEEWGNNISSGLREYWANLSDEEREERYRKQSRPHTEETKRLLSQKVRAAYAEGRMPERKPLTDEQKANVLRGMEEDLRKRRIIATQRKEEWEAGREEREMERRRKLSIANTGKVHSEETKAKLSEIATIQMSDPEIKEKHQQAVLEAMQRPEVKEAMANRPTPKPTKETIEKRAAAHRGRKNSPETIELMKQKRREWWANKKAEEAAANDL